MPRNMASLPLRTSHWTVSAPSNSTAPLSNLIYTSSPLLPSSLQPTQLLIKIHSISLNYRDVAYATGSYPFPTNTSNHSYTPCSDASGTVLVVGSSITSFKPGDRICTLLVHGWSEGPITQKHKTQCAGGVLDGVASEYVITTSDAVVRIPPEVVLGFKDLASLPCAALTAWNALFGLDGRKIEKGQWVVVQGSGSVALFGTSFAAAVNGRVVVVSSDVEGKEQKLKKLGAEVVIGSENWAVHVRGLTEDGEGVQHVLEMGGGQASMEESLKAVRGDGVVSMIGAMDYGKELNQGSGVGWAACFRSSAIVRGVFVGSAKQFLEMLDFIQLHRIKPVIDDTIFGLQDLKAAFEYQSDKRRFGKICVDV